MNAIAFGGGQREERSEQLRGEQGPDVGADEHEAQPGSQQDQMDGGGIGAFAACATMLILCMSGARSLTLVFAVLRVVPSAADTRVCCILAPFGTN